MSSEIAPELALRAAEVARRAGEIVSNGWCQQAWQKRDGAEHCAADALLVAGGVELYGLVRDHALQWTAGWDFINWNDRPGRTQAEVVELFESVAKHFDRLASRVPR